jgi:histidine triad (HIT) family protein
MIYDATNIFARILRGEIPATTVYEDAHSLAFMDVMPQSDGHVLVVPKAPCTGMEDADPDVLGQLIRVVQKLAPRIRDAMGAEGFRIAQFNGAAAGQTVFHLHFHIIPMRDGIALRPHSGKMADPAVLKVHAEKIRAAIAR